MRLFAEINSEGKLIRKKIHCREKNNMGKNKNAKTDARGSQKYCKKSHGIKTPWRFITIVLWILI